MEMWRSTPPGNSAVPAENESEVLLFCFREFIFQIILHLVVLNAPAVRDHSVDSLWNE